MRARLLLKSLAVGVLATLLTARIDDALVLAGWADVPPPEIAADAESVMVRRRGISSVEISLSHIGTEDVSPSAVYERASHETWSSDPLAGMGAVGWTGPVQHQILFRQGWPLDAFIASTTSQRGLRGGILVSGPPSSRIVAFSPVWPGLLGNTLMFACLSWLALSSCSVARRTLRRRAGVCERCAYSRQGLPENAPCPECAHK